METLYFICIYVVKKGKKFDYSWADIKKLKIIFDLKIGKLWNNSYIIKKTIWKCTDCSNNDTNNGGEMMYKLFKKALKKDLKIYLEERGFRQYKDETFICFHNELLLLVSSKG